MDKETVLCVSKHTQKKTGLWGNEPQEFNSTNSLLLHWLISGHPTVTHVPTWSFSPSPDAHVPLGASAQPRVPPKELLILVRSGELSPCCSLCEIQGNTWKKFRSNSKECYTCYQLHACCLVVTCLQVVWMEKIWTFLRGLSLYCMFRYFVIKVVINLYHSSNFMLTLFHLPSLNYQPC